jgi:tetratricopeptide (TPR) repeat protein
VIVPLQLRHDSALNTATAAWFLPGASTARWLDELTRCGLANMDTRLFVVPHSVDDQTSAGLLVVPRDADSVTESPGGLACRLHGGRLFVPLDAALHPPVADSELRSLSPLPISFYHPVFGLSSFELDSALRVSDLIEAPGETADDWNSARPGSPVLSELSAVVLIQPPAIEDIFGGAEEDIASDPMGDLPPAPNEPKETPSSKTSRGLRWIFAKSISEIAQHVPHTARRRTWWNDMEDWANEKLRAVSGELERLRNKELHRLLHLLDSDPEAGLRQAIPLNSFAHRGTAPPSARLGSHPLHFDPNRIGGQRADFWNVPPDLQEILRRRYREMADREMQLGRHRRAAYIYAELLGDLVSAANALKQGRLYREAALLYEEHLRNPLEAARCLAEGGLLAEAIERYEKLGRWLEVADLYERAGNREAAEEAVRRVVSERLARSDILGAARLVEERLHQPDEALQILFGAWPASHQAASCIGAAFQLLARLGKHEAALEQLARLKRDTVSHALLLPLLHALGSTARDYPHERVRHSAADFSRVLIARQLQRPGFSSDEAARLLEHLVRLAPHDRLLSRDTNRYLADRRGAELRTRRVVPPPLPVNKPAVLGRIELPRKLQWQWLGLRRESNWFFALGVTPQRLTLLRGVWDDVWKGTYQSLSWNCPAAAVRQGFVFEPTAEQGRAVALARSDGPPIPLQCFPASDVFFNQECFAGTPSWLPTQGFPFAIGEDAVWSVHLASGRAVLGCYDKVRGQLQRTLDITDDLLNGAMRTQDTRLSLTVVENTVAIALGNRLIWTRGDGGVTRVELPGQSIHVVGSIPNTRRGVAIMLNTGAVLYWAGTNDCIELDRDIKSPLGAFVPGGPLVLISGTQLLLLDVDSRGVHGVVRMETSGSPLVGVCAAANPGEFAVLEERGFVTVYRSSR